MARRASVTVSMAADTSGMFRLIRRVKRVAVDTSSGKTSEAAGTSRTSSKVRPSRLTLTSVEGKGRAIPAW